MDNIEKISYLLIGNSKMGQSVFEKSQRSEKQLAVGEAGYKGTESRIIGLQFSGKGVKRDGAGDEDGDAGDAAESGEGVRKKRKRVEKNERGMEMDGVDQGAKFLRAETESKTATATQPGKLSTPTTPPSTSPPPPPPSPTTLAPPSPPALTPPAPLATPPPSSPPCARPPHITYISRTTAIPILTNPPLFPTSISSSYSKKPQHTLLCCLCRRGLRPPPFNPGICGNVKCPHAVCRFCGLVGDEWEIREVGGGNGGGIGGMETGGGDSTGWGWGEGMGLLMVPEEEFEV